MGWTYRAIWLLCVSVVCECWRIPRSEADPPMHGEVQSPQYPQPYPPEQLREWHLAVPEGYQIKLTFEHLDIEASADCYYDSLTCVYGKQVLGKFCGQENSADGHHPGDQPVVSPGNTLSLIFQTDDSNPEPHQPIGFSAHYQAIDTDECSAPEPEDGPLCSQICHNTLGSYLCSCHHGYELRPDQRTCVLSCADGIFDEPEGQLSSPGYPEPSPLGLSCQYVISVEPGFVVTLTFSDKFHIESIDAEQGPQCQHHWLQVTIPEREPMKLCGGKSPGLMVTNSSTVTLDYHTDWAGFSHGWSLDYSTHRVQCPSPSSVTNGRVTPIFTDYLYRDYIQVRCDQGYKLMMNGQEIQSFSSMCKSNGEWHLSLPECHILDCGDPEAPLNGGVTFLSGSENQYGSVIQYNCNEPFYSLPDVVNANYTCAVDRRWTGDHGLPAIPPCIPVCGKPTNTLSIFGKIIRGDRAPPNTIPWQVMLEVNGNRGGGIVIEGRWVMTAAHNLKHDGVIVEKGNVKVFMGSNNAKLIRQKTPAAVESLHVHPGYNNVNRREPNFDNDIALMKLQEPITFNTATMPICLPKEDSVYHSGMGLYMGLISGFGITKINNRLTIDDHLKYAQIPVQDPESCSDFIDRSKRSHPGNEKAISDLTANMFCAGSDQDTDDSCQGDSGGALALHDDAGRFWAAGIISWGIGCGVPGSYGVYTKVVNYLGWINKTMQEN